jgi:plastocyanin
MKRIGAWLMAAATVGALAAPALAEDHRVTQKDKAFSTENVNVRTGDTIVFVNADTVTHNVFSVAKGHEFEIKTQRPGASDTVRVDGDGTFEILCAIHPRMKLRVQIGR